MFFRSAPLATLLLILCALGGGCADSSGGPISDFPDDDGDDGAHLENAGADVVDVLPNGTAQLSVFYIDDYGSPLPGVPVEFALADPAGGSSLTPSTPVTGDDGSASTLLRVGSEPSVNKFRVRVSAAGVAPIYIQVMVDDVARVSVEVAVVYMGSRDVDMRTVTALPSVTCEQALAAGVSGDVTYTYGDEETVKTFELGPGLHYSLVAWGRDRTNAKVAEGCVGFDAPIVASMQMQEPESIELVDTPMRLMNSYDLTLDLNVSASVARVREAVEAAAVAALPVTASPEGDFYLDALDATLRAAGNTSAADALATRRGSEDLAGALAAELEAAAVGAAAYGEALGAAAASFGNRLEVRTYGAGATDMAYMIEVRMVRARTGDGTDLLELSPTFVVPTAMVDADYSDTLGALVINTLWVELGLGSYGKALISALAAREQPPARAAGGCGVLAQFIADDGALGAACDASCRALVCDRALDTLDTASSNALTSLDAAHPTLGLSGQVWAHDRDGDGLVDDLGPASLMGNWGTSEDPVTGVVPTPVTSNLKQ
jgi:hypothetical protein